MGKDAGWKVFLSDDERYADVINGIGCKGKQIVKKDAFDVAVQYTNAKELIEAKEYYEKDGVVDMCKALTELIADGRQEGKDEKLREQVEKKVKKGLSVSVIADMLEESIETIEDIIQSL